MSKNLAEERLLTAREALLGVYPPPAGREAAGMPVRKVLSAMFRARWFLGVTAAVGLAIGLFLAITTPNTYVSEGTFLFTTSGSESIHVDLTRSSDTKAEAVAANAVHVLQADTLLRRVVEHVTPTAILQPYQPDDRHAGSLSQLLHRIQRDWNAENVAGATVDEALKFLRKRLLVERSRLSDVLIATCATHDPALAQRILGVYMQEAQRWHQEQYDDPKVYDEVKRRAEGAAAARGLAQRKLAEFLEQSKVQNTFAFELERVRADAADATGRERDNRLAIERTRLQITELEKRLQTLSPTVTVRRRPPTQKSIEVLQEEISKLQVERSRTAVESANAADVQVLDHKIGKLEQDIRRILEDASKAPTYDFEEPNPEHAEAMTQLGRLKGQLVTDGAISQQLQRDRDGAATRLRRMLELEPMHTGLRDVVARTEEDQRVAEAALARAELKRQLQLGNFSSLKVIDDASLPLEKEGPNRLKLILGGLCVGLFAGIGMVLARTVPDRTVRTPHDLEALEGVTVVGVMPRLHNKNLRRHVAVRMRGW